MLLYVEVGMISSHIGSNQLSDISGRNHVCRVSAGEPLRKL